MNSMNWFIIMVIPMLFIAVVAQYLGSPWAFFLIGLMIMAGILSTQKLIEETVGENKK